MGPSAEEFSGGNGSHPGRTFRRAEVYRGNRVLHPGALARSPGHSERWGGQTFAGGNQGGLRRRSLRASHCRSVFASHYLGNGINQITSYRSVDYEKLKGQIEDREVKSGARKALDQQLILATRALARELLAEEHAAMAQTRRQKKSQELSAQLAQLPEGDTPDRTALQRKLYR